MMAIRFGAFFCLLMLAIPGQAWDTGDTWGATVEYESDIDIDYTICGFMKGWFKQTGSGEWTYTGELLVSHPVSGDMILVHCFSFQGSGTGSADFWDDNFGCEATVEMTGHLIGELWLTVVDLNPVKICLKSIFSGQWLWWIPGCEHWWDPITGSTEMAFDFYPYHQDFIWPLLPGDDWDFNLYARRFLKGNWKGYIVDLGEYELIVDNPDELNTVVHSTVGYSEWINGCESVPVRHISPFNITGLSAWCSDWDFFSTRSINWIHSLDSMMKWDASSETATPSPTPVTPTATPAISPTPTSEPCNKTQVDIHMPYVMYFAGLPCSVMARVCNADPCLLWDYPLIIVLEIGDDFLFGPEFRETYSDYKGQFHAFAPGMTWIPVVDEFRWPESAGSGHARWYGVLLKPDYTAIHGDMGSTAFAWF